jgi:hypothetical protein
MLTSIASHLAHRKCDRVMRQSPNSVTTLRTSSSHQAIASNTEVTATASIRISSEIGKNTTCKTEGTNGPRGHCLVEETEAHVVVGLLLNRSSAPSRYQGTKEVNVPSPPPSPPSSPPRHRRRHRQRQHHHRPRRHHLLRRRTGRTRAWSCPRH